MNKYIFPFYRVLVPKPVRTYFLKKKLRKKIFNYFSGMPPALVTDEQRELLFYLENNPVSLFPYPFNSEYLPKNIEVFLDESNGMRYVLQSGKRLYFKKGWGNSKVRRAYAALSKEQDPASPHCYLSDDFVVGSDDVIADIGASEGNFSLSQIEKVKKIYLIDYDREWIRALEATFAPWKDKVEIITKYVSDTDNDRNITLDTLLVQRNDITFLKIDVEGFEQKVLHGAEKFISGSMPLKMALCTYHKHSDEEIFTPLLEKNGFQVKVSHGYMIPLFDKKIKSPWLRRVLIRATR
jgi:predicted RNA methylase